MIWDLTDTAIAQADEKVRVPSEGELMVLMAAMLLHQGRAFSDLADHQLVLTEASLEGIVQIIEHRLGSLARDIGTGKALRARLLELVGLKLSNPVGGPVW